MNRTGDLRKVVWREGVGGLKVCFLGWGGGSGQGLANSLILDLKGG